MGYYTSHRVYLKRLADARERTVQLQLATDSANTRVKELSASLSLLLKSEEVNKKIEYKKSVAIKKVDDLSADHVGIANLWEERLREFRSNNSVVGK